MVESLMIFFTKYPITLTSSSKMMLSFLIRFCLRANLYNTILFFRQNTIIFLFFDSTYFSFMAKHINSLMCGNFFECFR